MFMPTSDSFQLVGLTHAGGSDGTNIHSEYVNLTRSDNSNWLKQMDTTYSLGIYSSCENDSCKYQPAFVQIMDFMKLVKQKLKVLDIDETLLKRDVNTGFSGGEKKRNEIFQMAVLNPKLAILDETDSGLDIDALRAVGNGVTKLRSPERAIVVITHYQRLLNHIEPDFVHVLMNGRMVRSGDRSLALKLENEGYAWLEDELNSELNLVTA